MSVLCCMVCRHRKKGHHLVVQRGATTSGTKWYHVAPRGTTLASSGATVVPPLHGWLHHMCKSGTTVAQRWCHSSARWCHVAPRGTTWCHRWHHIAPPGSATFFLCLQTIQQSTDRVVPPDTGMVCGADKLLISMISSDATVLNVWIWYN